MKFGESSEPEPPDQSQPDPHQVLTLMQSPAVAKMGPAGTRSVGLFQQLFRRLLPLGRSRSQLRSDTKEQVGDQLIKLKKKR